MKSIVVVLFLAFARLGLAQQVFVGVKGGGNYGSAIIDNTVFNATMDIKYEPGFNMGLILKFLQKKEKAFLKAGIQFSAIYTQKGWQQTFITNEPKYSAQMNYVEIPVEAIGYFGNKQNYFITVGCYFEYLLGNDHDNVPNLDNLGGQDFYTYRPSRDPDTGYGLRFSTGFFTSHAFGMMHVEGFFSYSISNFIESGKLISEIPDISNLFVAGFSIGYLMQVKGKKER